MEMILIMIHNNMKEYINNKDSNNNTTTTVTVISMKCIKRGLNEIDTNIQKNE